MRDDELQVLGTTTGTDSHKGWIKAGVSMVVFAVLIVAAAVVYQYVLRSKTGTLSGDTTIIPELQQAVDSLLNDELETIDGQQGQAIVMDVQTGQILAMAGLERRFDGKFQPCNNFSYQQELGTAMISAAVLALLETGEVKMTDEVDTGNGIWEVDDGDVLDHNWRDGGYGKITLERAFEVSSNIAVTKTVRKTFNGRERLYFDLLDKMSFGQPDSITGLVGLKPLVASSQNDSLGAKRRLLWNAIGYERKIAPIQALTFYNAIANNGKMVKPMLKKRETEVINEQIASKENIAEMQRLLYESVRDGLGKKAALPDVAVAGKTGTIMVKEIDSIQEYHLMFCGYFPAEAPKYSIIVSLNKLGLPASGGGMAGVLFHDIAEWMTTNNLHTSYEKGEKEY
jgi:cell division protein FtsI (penicillin-binding protein 3)